MEKAYVLKSGMPNLKGLQGYSEEACLPVENAAVLLEKLSRWPPIRNWD